MRQLTGLDASFLNLETPSTPLHVASLMVLDPTGVEGFGYDRVAALVEERLHTLAPFRWRLAPVPLGIDHPYWIVDPDFDLEFHLRHAAVPPPGGPQEVAEVVARIHARPLDRARPLWEMYVIEGLEDGRIGVMTKMHHAAIDGVSGAEIAGALLDLTPERDPGRAGGQGPPADREPGAVEMLLRGSVGLLRQPRRVLRTAVRTARAVPGLGGFAEMALPRRRTGDGGLLEAPRLQAPATPFNGTISPHRRFAYGSLPLDVVKSVKDAHGATVNDVVLAVCTGALRRYLLEHDALPDVPLQALVPISVRSEASAGEHGNQVTAMVAVLPTHLEDPAGRLAAIHERMQVAKTANAVPADLLQDYTQFATPALAARAARVVARTRWADRVRLPVNLVVSNIPGPRVPLYLAGARLEHYYPISAVVDGVGLNITVQSYRDLIDVGLVSDRDLVPDLWGLLDHLEAALDELAAMVGGGGATA